MTMPSLRILLLLPLLLLAVGAPTAAPPTALELHIDGPIGPATADYMQRGLERAAASGAPLVLLRMDTPGGLDNSMRDIIKAILASPVPVVSYVAPSGARAASAGTYILYASHVAAMVPATNLGAATPIELLPSSGDKAPDDTATDKEAAPAQPKDAKTRKRVNDAVAYIRSLATLRGRNGDWAEQAVRRGVSLEAQAALKAKVIDLIATDRSKLLEELNGRTVSVGNANVTLHTAGLRVQSLSPDWRSELLAVITDPNVAYILMLIGIYGLIFELANPGTVLPGVMGGIALLLALFAFQALPIDYAGLGLLLLGVALMVAEAFAPSFGALGIGGTVAFVIGSVMLMDTNAPGYGISPALIGAVALFSALLFALLLGMVLKARRRPVRSGAEEMLGAAAQVLHDFEGEGRVRAHGEVWRARSAVPLHAGQQVRVVRLDGLTLDVEPTD